MTDSDAVDLRRVRRATSSDREAVVRILTAAFYDDPLMRWVFPHASRREGALRRIFEMEANTFLQQGLVFLAENEQAATTWMPPSVKESLNPLTVLRNLPAWFLASGPLRSIQDLRAFAATERRHPKEPHYYLGSVGVDPTSQGQGFGSALLEEMMPRIDAERMPSYLLNSNERNLPLYERFGYQVVEALQIPHGGPLLWSMWRERVS
jgi:ribosomal protein S18 acetylase RimI-like enzyme